MSWYGGNGGWGRCVIFFLFPVCDGGMREGLPLACVAVRKGWLGEVCEGFGFPFEGMRVKSRSGQQVLYEQGANPSLSCCAVVLSCLHCRGLDMGPGPGLVTHFFSRNS